MSNIAQNAPVQTAKLRIGGMHCPNCELVIERSLVLLPGVSTVHASYRRGAAEISYSGSLGLDELRRILRNEGYSVSMWDAVKHNSFRDYLEIGAVFVAILAIALVLGRYQILPRGLGVSEEMSYGLVFLIGLVASVSSCMAVTGGLLVALAAKYNAATSDLPRIRRFKPHLYFNAGRIISYTLLGGVVGLLGSTLTLSPEANGILMIVVSVVMIVLGLQMLSLFPSLGRLLPIFPKSLSRSLDDLAERKTEGGAFLFGAATFFLPCGFTQALQLYVLAKGDFAIGALTMLAFALGTLPALLSLSVVSSFAKGPFQKHLLRVAGVAVILLGIMNIQYGLVLTRTALALGIGHFIGKAAAQEALAAEKQVVQMRIDSYDYLPNRFTVRQGVPVEWRIDARQAAGCGLILLAPKLGIRKFLSPSNTTVITFTPEQPGDFPFNCGMGMMTPGSKFTVLPNKKIKL